MGPGRIQEPRITPSEIKLLEEQHMDNLEVNSDSDSVYSVQGMDKNMFFLTHDMVAEGHVNEFEADMCVHLRKHLMRQGYDSQQILILTTTVEQGTFVQQQDLSSRVELYDFVGGTEVQIVILSLVESMPQDLLDENDLNLDSAFQIFADITKCALRYSISGFYVLGHESLLKVSSARGTSQWSELLDEFTNLNAIGPSLILGHLGNQPLIALSSQNWENPRDLGLCLEIRDCGHPCPRKRHPYDPFHEHPDVICEYECQRVCPGGGHKCMGSCYEVCQPCQIFVSVSMPCCGHTFSGPCVEINKDKKFASNAST